MSVDNDNFPLWLTGQFFSSEENIGYKMNVLGTELENSIITNMFNIHLFSWILDALRKQYFL